MFRIELYFTLVCTSTFKYFIDFVYRNQWPLGDILDKKFSYAIVLALLPWQLSSSAIFTCMTGCVNAWKTIAWNCRVVCLLRVLVMQFQNFMTNHIIFILSMLVSDWLTTFAHAQCGCLSRVGHAIFDLHD